MEAASLVVAILAMIFAGVSALVAWLQRRDAISARGDAERSAAAARDAADAAARTAAAQERLTAATEAEAQRPWSVTPMGHQTYRLSNLAPSPLFDVHLDLTGIGHDQHHDVVDQGATRMFAAAADMGIADPRVHVSFRRTPEGPVETWSDALPEPGSNEPPPRGRKMW